ncbi:tail protein [Bacillus phage G]|uniref:Gp369 n=1 Tax=Bacillus phage G TaxID=2884420 RepID=G3MAB0_9CAUD|nr:tail protein [Bacillus phage G]AEO93628.1 gp369 [Bacillus phage G]
MSLYVGKPKGTGGGSSGGGGNANIDDTVISVTSTWSSNKINSAKADKAHNHEITDVVGLSEKLSNITPSEHTHAIADVLDLQLSLDGKADKTHIHQIGDVMGLAEKLETITPGDHNHEIDDITDLQLALDRKANTNHTHAIANITDLQSELDSKSSLIHKHEMSDINGLQTEFSKKADVNHTHTIANIPSLQTELDSKSNINHVHKWVEILEKPVSTPNNIDKAVTSTHTHTNRNVIDFLGGDGDTLTYKGQPIDGFKSVYSLTERNNIPMTERKNGMLCLTLEDGALYYLKGGIDNAFWEIFAVAAGGATSASSLEYTPTGELTAINVQAALDQLETNKADRKNLYTKTETDNLLAGHSHDYSSIANTPDLSSLHSHSNKATLDKFGESMGELTFKGKTVGTMIADIYDMDGDGVIDKAATLDGLVVSPSTLNYAVGLTGNIQAQINAISSGTVFKGEFNTWAAMLLALPNPSKGFWIFITADETKGGAKTQYYHDGTEWIYGGGSSNVPAATNTVLGGIKLAGVLENPNSTSDNPLLKATGVAPGIYNNANLIIDEDGRISHAENGSSAFINDDVVAEKETWSSNKINDELVKKSNSNHTHPQLHDADQLGNVKLDGTKVADKKIIAYNAVSGKAEWVDPTGGKVYVGSKVIPGDFRLVAGSYVNLFIDETAKTITINCTAMGGGGGVPTLTEITHTELVPAGGQVRLSLDAAFNKYDIRTLEMHNTESMVMSVSVFDQRIDGRRVYDSNKEISTYDIVNVPCHDKDQSEKIHLLLTNHGTKDTVASLIINTTSLI